MPRVRDLLYRFRPSAAPGSASATGVPADRARDLATELEPVFAALADTEHECAAVVEHGRVEAAGITAHAATAAQALRSAGRASLAAERAAATAAVHAARAAEAGAASAAVDRAVAVHEHAERLLPQYVDAVVDAVRALVDGQPEPGPQGSAPGGAS